MTITYVKEVSGRAGTVGEESTRSFIFTSDTAFDSEYDVYRNINCPKIGSRHPNSRFSLFYLKRGDLTISQSSSNWARWDVEAKYTIPDPNEPTPQVEQDFSQIDEIEQPDFTPKISVDFEDFSSPLENAIRQPDSPSSKETISDLAAFPVVNSALEKYIPVPEVFRENVIIRVTRNLKSSSALISDALDLRNTINSDAFSFTRGPARIDITPYHCRIKVRLSEEQEYRTKQDKKAKYTPLEVQFKVSANSWKIKLLDYGTYYLSASGKNIETRKVDNDWGLASGVTQKPFTDDENNRTQGYLNGTGQQLGASQAPAFNEYDGYIIKKHGSFYKRITRG